MLLADYLYRISGKFNKDIQVCGAELAMRADSLRNKSDVVYIAESSNFTSAESDTSKASISELTDSYCEGIKITALNKAASHLGNYKYLVYRLAKGNVKTIILTVNLRSFGVNWIESKLETNLSRTNIFYYQIPAVFKKLMLSFKLYDNVEEFKREKRIKKHYKNSTFQLPSGKFKNVREWDGYMFSKGHFLSDGNRDVAKCELSCHFIKNYAFEITEDNPRLKDLDDITTFCNNNNIRLVLNLLPENTELADSLCGNDLLTLMRNNAKLLEDRFSKKTIFVNNLELLKDSNFIDRNWPTEHYNLAGRGAIARKISEKLCK